MNIYEKQNLLQKTLMVASDENEIIDVNIVSKAPKGLTYLCQDTKTEEDIEKNKIFIITYKKKNRKWLKVSYDVEHETANTTDIAQLAEDLIQILRKRHFMAFR